MEVIDRIVNGFRASSVLMRIVWINIAVFVLLRLCAIVCVFSGAPDFIATILDYVMLPSSPLVLLTRPWTLVTYMFAQYDLLHIVFNILWLYWFGTMFLMTASPRQLTVLYFYGGLAGAVLFMVAYGVFPLFSGSQGTLIGSSASVIAIVTAVAILMPHFKMHLLFIGAVSVKWIAIATIVLVLIGATGSNAGGEIAHIGGVIAGAIFATQLKRGHDITEPVSSLWTRATAPASRPARRKSASPTQPQSTPGGLSKDERIELDAILDKIKKSGYSALTSQERDRLFNVSRKIK